MARAENRLRALSGAKRPAVQAALDIGCSKIACVIARRDPIDPGKYEFLGGGRHQSKGFTGGAITDLEGLERAVRLAVEDAERRSGQRIDRVSLAVTGPKVACALAGAGVDLGARPIAQKDVARVLAAAIAKSVDKSQALLSANTVAFRVDDQDGVRDPRGMRAKRLGALVSVVTAPKSLMRNLEECLARAHLGLERAAPASLAAAHGALIEDERENGAVCIDMGAGVTNACVYLNGAPAWTVCLPSGGRRVTSDIAQGVGTTFSAAERMKTLFGSADPNAPGAAERIEAPRLGDDGRLQASKMARGELAVIIAPRVEETFEYILKALETSPVGKVLPRRIVLTGGASQLAGVKDAAAQVFRTPVRLARPVDAEILGETFATPAFAGAAGLLTLDQVGRTDAMRAMRPQDGGETDKGGIVNKAYVWLKENF